MAEESTERFVDQAEKQIAPQDTWDQLTVNQLIDTKTLIEERLWQFQRTPQIALVLRRSLDSITKLIASHENG